jgi:putative flavoprotein involved in K+ transport
MNTLPATVDVAVIGAGQAGLSTAYHLNKAGLEFVVLDAASRLGEVWRNRWDSLTLFTSARFSGLPGLAFPGDRSHYPAKDEVPEYFERYAAFHGLPILLDHRVTQLTRSAEGFVLTTEHGTCLARKVVVATGAFQRPYTPEFSLPPEIVQLHSHDYRNPSQLPQGTVLVVGGGNSGSQIAEELATTRDVILSQGQKLPKIPQQLLGRDIWAFCLPLLRLPVVGPLKGPDPVIGPRKDLQAKVRRVSRIVAAESAGLVTSDGETIKPAAVVWATGYRDDWQWLDPSLLDGQGRPRHASGIGDGIYYVGLYRLSTRGSALLGFVKHDAERIVKALRSGG